MRRVCEWLIMLSLFPVWLILALLHWLGHWMFGEYEDYER